MEQSTFSFELTSTNPDAELGFECWVNDQCVFDTDHVAESTMVHGNLPNNSIETEHCLKLVLKNKQPQHTQVSNTGEILTDSCLTISQLKFDEIALGFDILQNAVYRHNFNNTTQSTEHKFFGTLGCNGIVELKFSTPVYLWLLENM
jgi:hypothetical protein